LTLRSSEDFTPSTGFSFRLFFGNENYICPCPRWLSLKDLFYHLF